MPAHRSGYGAHVEDCGEDVQKWTNADFEVLTRKVCRFAERHDIPILSTHGGGYKRRVAMAAAVRQVRRTRINKQPNPNMRCLKPCQQD